MTNNAGRATKTTSPAYGLVSSPVRTAIARATKTTAEAVVTTTPRTASGCESASRLVTRTLLQALHVGHQGLKVLGGKLAVLVLHRRLLGRFDLGRRVLWVLNPVLNLGSCQLGPHAVERACFAALAGDGM